MLLGNPEPPGMVGGQERGSADGIYASLCWTLGSQKSEFSCPKRGVGSGGEQTAVGKRALTGQRVGGPTKRVGAK